MAKKLGLKLGGLIALGGGTWYFFNSDWYTTRYTGFFKKRILVRDENVLITTEPPANTPPTDLGGIYVYGVDGSVISNYNFIGSDMAFPLQKESGKYDNVAELQAFLVFANTDNNLAIDGYFGALTEAAVRGEVGGLANQCNEFELLADNSYSDVCIDEGSYGYAPIYHPDTDTSSDEFDEDSTDLLYDTITEEYFTDVVKPELDYFMSADCLELYDEETCA
jgi:hypothetical protein